MTYRAFGKRTKSDPKALAACMRASRKPVPPERLAELTVPVLIAVGTKDDVAGSPRELARHIPHADILIIPDKDHMSAVGDGVHKAGVVGFLRGA
jgi:pimeloyl-ACP methyl ester carboxylesterase